jgi:hypothetical protein
LSTLNGKSVVVKDAFVYSNKGWFMFEEVLFLPTSATNT